MEKFRLPAIFLAAPPTNDRQRDTMLRMTLAFKWRDFLANIVAANPLLPSSVRTFLLRCYGLTIGKTTFIAPCCFFGSKRISIGVHCRLNRGCFLDRGPIVIGDNCYLGMQSLICTSTHEMGPSSQRAGKYIDKEIVIGDGCWIGARSIILPGIHIGAGTVIGAGSVVTKNCDGDSLYCGNPARLVRTLSGHLKSSSEASEAL
jgi:maltose O-acetyltransferase